MASDEELVGRVATGDQEALAELLRRWQRRLLAFLRARGGGEDVEDLYQETWLRVVRAAPRFDPGRSFSTWLFTIAVNLARDRLRAEPPGAFTGDIERADPAAGIETEEARIDALALLARLPDEQREVVALRYLLDLDEQETARILEIPAGTVKSRLHHAMRRLWKIARSRPTTR